MLLTYYGLGLFQHLEFRQETFRHGHLITGTFRHEEISAGEYFGMGILWYHGRFSTVSGYFGTYTFWHHAKQYRHFGTDISA